MLPHDTSGEENPRSDSDHSTHPEGINDDVIDGNAADENNSTAEANHNHPLTCPELNECLFHQACVLSLIKTYCWGHDSVLRRNISVAVTCKADQEVVDNLQL